MNARAPAAGAPVRGGPGQSFRGRITAAILLTAFAVLFFGCVLFMLEQHRLDTTAVRTTETNFARFLARAEAGPLARGDLAAIRTALQSMDQTPLVETAEVRDGAGRIVAQYSTARRPPLGAPMIAAAPIVVDGRRVGRVTLRCEPPAIDLLLPRYVAMGGALFFAAMALALFLGRWLAWRITEPVARLSASMDEVGRSGDFAQRVEPTADDELGRLTESFNGLLARLNANDKTLRRTMGELVNARDAAHAANVQKSQFLANMSHEIRTPLNGVLAMAQILGRAELEPQQHEQVEVIRTSGEALLAILNDILDVSKIEAGKFELEVADFDVDELVGATAAGFSAVAAQKRLRFAVEVEEPARGLRRGDATRVRQILSNLISNALKFTDQGEVSLHVALEPSAAAAEAAGEQLHIAVADTGMGIAPEKRSLLFQKFSQLDASTTRRFGGTGLGLAICHELCVLMGGRVWVESELDQGSTFHVVLPLPRVGPPAVAASPALAVVDVDLDERQVGREAAGEPGPRDPDADGPGADGPGAADQEADGPPLRVLAAEDNPTNQLVLSTVVQIFGLDLTLTANGREAVDAWERERFDVILMDIQMPVMDGIAATLAIRAAEAASGRARTPIIALSANALVHQVAEYLSAGMDGHVAKPIELDKLQAALEVALTPPGEAAATEAA